MLRTKRAYEAAEKQDGTRFLVDRLWPRGIKKEDLEVQEWLRELGPSDELRKWFGHDPARWTEFEKRYFAELDQKRELLQPIVDALRKGDVTLVYGAKDTEHNQAVALKAYIEKHLVKEA